MPRYALAVDDEGNVVQGVSRTLFEEVRCDERAVFDATGVRLRRLPLTPERVKAALA